MSTELKITIRDCERVLKRDFLVYEDVTFREDDPIIMQCVKEVTEEFQGEPEDIKITATMILQ